ncbi:MAG: hypothetical protein LC797_12660 [Chloroflexi bacterium]|nr:hypothetical protein [Chloroflexota bacterium]
MTGPVRALVVSLIVVGALLAVIAALTGLLLGLALVVGLAVLNVVYLPRAAARLRLRPVWLALMLIPITILVGWVVGGVPGAGWGAAIWVAAIGLPRVIGRDLVRRARRRFDARRGYFDVRPRASTLDGSTRPIAGPGGRPSPHAGDRAQGEFDL